MIAVTAAKRPFPSVWEEVGDTEQGRGQKYEKLWLKVVFFVGETPKHWAVTI